MGNTQSIEAPQRRQTQKLSKPRTVNSATVLNTNGFASSPGLSPMSRLSTQLLPYSPDPSPTTTAPSEALDELEQDLSRRASVISLGRRESRRRSVFRSKSSQGTARQEKRISLIGLGSGPGDKPSRANSLTYESAVAAYGQKSTENWLPQSRSRTSWNYDMSSYAAKRLLNLVEEPPFEQSTAMSENRATVISAATWKNSNPSQPASSPITRVNSDLSLYMPVRRRSIVRTPGVATRSQSTHETSRPNYRYSHPPTPSLSRQQSFESYRGGILSMPPLKIDPDSVPRVVTPCEEDYQSIGAFKLGSLRIVNCDASPVSPEIEKDPKSTWGKGTAGTDQEYFLGSQTSGLNVADKTLPPAPLNEQRKPDLKLLSPISTTFSPAAASSDPMSKGVSSLVPMAPGEYLADITFSPFSLESSRPASPDFQATSKPTATEDKLFDDDAQLEYSSAEVLDVRLDPNAKSQPETAGLAHKTFSRTDSGFVSTTSPSSELPHKPLAKADSGYSSNVSLRSLNSKSKNTDWDPSWALEKRDSQSSPLEEDPASTVEQPPSEPEREAPPPPVPPKDFPPNHAQQTKGPATPQTSLSLASRQSETHLSPSAAAKKSRHTPSPINSIQSSEQGLKSPDSIPLTPLSARSTKSDTSTSTLSIGSGSHRPSKLQRLLSGARRKSSGPLTVHTTHVFEKSGIPSIPHDVEFKLHERTGLFPITTKRLALKPHGSKDTLKTIFSVGSVEATLEAVVSLPAVPVIPEKALGSNPTTHESQHWHTSEASTVADHPMSLILRKPIVRKPVPNSQEAIRAKEKLVEGSIEPEVILPVEAELTTYSSINNSLGNNAYDAAFKAMADERDVYFSPTSSGARRTMSMTASMERTWNIRRSSQRGSSANSTMDLPSPSLPSPLFAREMFPEKKSKTPPPVSMMNRRPMSLRVPPPLRPQSSSGRASGGLPDFQVGREISMSYPAGRPPMARKTSRENVHSYPSYQQARATSENLSESPPPIPAMDPRRFSAFQKHQLGSTANTKLPTWDVQTDHDMSIRHSRSSLDGHSRHNSMSSNRSYDDYTTQASGNSQARRTLSVRQPPLRHHSSFDDFGQQSNPRRGYPPSMSNGYTAPSKAINDPRNNRPNAPQHQQFEQHGRQPPYVPRGHYRNRSMGSRDGYGPSPPYRILHSYNSPAYRNAPIWG